VGDLFREYPGTWCIAGGWALDLFAGGQSRAHSDVDIQVDRADLPILHQSLPGWLLYAAHGILTPWAAGTPFPQEVHDIWCRRPGHRWEFQLMVVEPNDREWVFRRDARIRGPRDSMMQTIDGLPVLAPEIQLLYKSNNPDLAKNDHDFRLALPLLQESQRAWLSANLALLYGEHPWLPILRNTG
jgi:hypothetical protein